MRRAIFTLGILLLLNPPGFGCTFLPTDRPVEIDANGTLLVTSVTPPPGLSSRPVEIDANGVLLVASVTPPPGLSSRPVEIDANGALLVASVTPPPGLSSRPVEIDENGALLVTSVTPPPGLSSRPVEINEFGRLLIGLSSIPTIDVTGMAILVTILVLTGAAMIRRRRSRAASR
jgi:hypothetical protein